MKRATERCARLGCPRPVVGRVVPQYGHPWNVCARHKDTVLATFQKFDNRQGEGSRFEPGKDTR